MSNEAFEPRLVGFLCNWCSYTGADLAGTARMAYAPNMRIIRKLGPLLSMNGGKDEQREA